MSLDLIELENFHSNLNSTQSLNQLKCIKGSAKYFHYCCDGHNDVGYGCGYRTTQTICSWIKNQTIEENKKFNTNKKVVEEPTVLEIQRILVECGDKPSSFAGSREWIGCFESSIVIDYLYDVPCKIIHSDRGKLESHVQDLVNYFDAYGCPIMMGGDLDNASKGVIGIANDELKNSNFLIVDPHYSQPKANKKKLIDEEWISWRLLDTFEQNSFYNFCLPQKKAYDF